MFSLKGITVSILIFNYESWKTLTSPDLKFERFIRNSSPSLKRYLGNKIK